MAEIKPINWENGQLFLLDQTRLPHQQHWLAMRGSKQVSNAIKTMRVRGAPAIGIAAAYGMALAARQIQNHVMPKFLASLEIKAMELASSRPTAVNLRWAIEACLETARQCETPEQAKQNLVNKAEELHRKDILANEALGRYGASLLPESGGVLTHCNAGALATAGFGTALGVIRAAWEEGKRFQAFCTETRPWLQGARLTAWELVQLGIPASLIVDSAAGSLMGSGEVNIVVVGADRVAANGDVANKIGTYSLSILAKEHGIPFLVAAPTSTIDLNMPTGDQIVVEERNPMEVTHWAGRKTAATGIAVRNPSFDITPARYITAIITECGIAQAPYKTELSKLVAKQSTEVSV